MHQPTIEWVPYRMLRTGCAWRYLLRRHGAWQTVYYYLRKWSLGGTDLANHTNVCKAVTSRADRCLFLIVLEVGGEFKRAAGR